MGLFERVLILETSSKIGEVAVASADGVLTHRFLPEARRHARDLTARCEELLAERSWKARDITAVIVSIGPGSYTGLRIGIASAKALAYSTGCALFAVPTFSAIAERIAATAEKLEIIADAQQGQVYCQHWMKLEGGWEEADAVRIRLFAEWAADVAAGSSIAGPASSMYAEKLPAGANLVREEFRESSSVGLLKLAMRQESRWRAAGWDLEPIYLRGSSAEEKRKLA